MSRPERDCYLCPAFTHWTSDVVGVRQDNGHVWAADRKCAVAQVADDRIVDESEITDLRAAIS